MFVDKLEGLWKDAVFGHKFNDPVMFIDGTNLFIRAFACTHQTNTKKIHVGGIQGFLKSLGKLCQQFKPVRVVILFDGEGGSLPRRKIYPEYKANRDKTRLLNPNVFFNKEEESESQQEQIIRLISYLKCIPVTLLCLDMVEADDVLSWVSNWIRSKSQKNPHIIVSSDQDYLQLVNDWRVVYNGQKDILFDTETIIDKYNVSPNNFLMYRCLIGDNSDNVKGIYGIANKTATTLFPMLADNKPISINEILEISEKASQEKKSKKIWTTLLESKSTLELNYELMELGEYPFTEIQQEAILGQLKAPRTYDPVQFTKMAMEDELDFTDAISWLEKKFSSLK